MKTKFPTAEEARAGRKWFIVDAAGQTVGRLASRIAAQLRGKNNPSFVPHHDCGDFVVVINAEKVKFTGQKTQKKEYHHHTGYIGSVKTVTAAQLLARRPEEVLKAAVSGMLPKTYLGKQQILKLKIYRGSSHPHAAQKPTPMN